MTGTGHELVRPVAFTAPGECPHAADQNPVTGSPDLEESVDMSIRTRALTAGTAAALVVPVLLPSAALADTAIHIPVTSVAHGAPGSTVTVASAAVPPSMVGAVCDVTVGTANQHSVHPGNDLVVTTGASTIVVADFEDGSGAVHGGHVLELLGDTIVVQVRFGADGATSSGTTVTLGDCVVPEPPTTTTAAPTTIEAPTTTEAPTTVTTVPEVVDNHPDLPIDPSVPPTLTTVAAETVPTTAAPASTSPSNTEAVAEPRQTLPVTGSEAGLLAALGAVLVGAGSAAVRTSRRRA